MSLLGIIETLRRNLKTVVVAGCVVLALVVVADVVRVTTAVEHEAASPSEAAPAKEGASEPSAHPGDQAVPDLAVAAFGEHAVEEAGFHEEAPAHGFWAATYHIAENVPGFWTAFGFLGCILLVVVSKTYGHAGISEREDYYGE